MSINHVTGVRADIAQMLDKIRDISNKSSVFHGVQQVDKSSDFGGVMSSAKSMLQTVNDTQNKADMLKDKFLQGDPNVSLSQVLVTNEKSKIAFEGLIIVRNKCLEAYKEIMNMPV